MPGLRICRPAADWLSLPLLAADLRNLVSIEPTEKVYSTVLVIGKALAPKFPWGFPAAVLAEMSAWSGLITASPLQEIVGFERGKQRLEVSQASRAGSTLQLAYPEAWHQRQDLPGSLEVPLIWLGWALPKQTSCVGSRMEMA